MDKKGQCVRVVMVGHNHCYWHKPKEVKPPKPSKKRGLVMIAQRAMLLEDSLAAVRKIANGHSDPMALCKNVLARFHD
jgi:hypothetical protein